MAANTVVSRIQSLPNISSAVLDTDRTLFHFTYNRANGFSKDYTVFMPTRDDYELSAEVVDKAISKGANLIVYDNWIMGTDYGKEYAKTKKINAYSYSNFLAIIYNNGYL